MLEVQASGKCIDNAGSRTRGAPLQGWKCSARNLNQRFALAWQDKTNRAAAIRNKLSGMCLDVKGQSGKSGARIVQTGCGKSDSQIWELMKSGTNDWFLIAARHSRLCLTLARKDRRHSFLTQSKCNKRNANQKFKLRT
jgi:hypothetical protein